MYTCTGQKSLEDIHSMQYTHVQYMHNICTHTQTRYFWKYTLHAVYSIRMYNISITMFNECT